MPRRRKKAFKIRLKNETVKSMLAVGLLLFAFLSLLSFVLPNYSLNSFISEAYYKVFGYTAFLVPFIIILFSLFFLRLKWRLLEPRFLAGFSVLTISLGLVLHVFYLGGDGYASALDGKGGGFLGYKIASVLSQAISRPGALLAGIFLTLVSVLLMFDVPMDLITDKITALLHKLRLPSFKLPSLRKGSSIEQAEFANVTSGMPEQSQITMFTPSVPADEPLEDDNFEIVSSYAEPQNSSSTLLDGEDDLISVSSIGGVPVVENKLPYANKIWEYPPKELLQDPPVLQVDENVNEQRRKIIVEKLRSFGINVRVVDTNPGPTVTRFAIEAPAGAKIAKIAALQSDLAMALASPTGSVRIEAPIPGKNLVGIEVPNTIRSPVLFKEVLLSDSMRGLKSKLGVAMGKDVGGYTVVYDIARMPHLLVAGATGSGKSVFLHSLMFSLLFRSSPQEVKFILIDPKRVELIHYADIPHLMVPVVTEIEKAPSIFRWAVSEMERRYKLFEAARARNIENYNEKSGFQALSNIVIMVDELAEIMVTDPAAVEKSIIRLGQLSRATGIHLILTVQRPSTDVLTGLIKANIPCRVAFNVTSQVDSRVIIDQPGAEKLLGSGDMLFVPPDASKPVRLQGAYVSDSEIANTVAWLKNTGFEPDYRQDIFNMPEEDRRSSSGMGGMDDVDDLYDKAVDVVTTSGKASISYLQRRLSIGYSRAARIMDQMEERGVVTSQSGMKGRELALGGGISFSHSDSDDDLIS